MLKKVLQFSFSGFLFLYITGCGISHRTVVQPEQNTAQAEGKQPEPPAMNVSSSTENISGVQKQLQNAHQQWKGTPYVYGGNSNGGVDCSAFTKIVFRDYFDKNLPRHTRSQLQEGSGVRRRSIQTGDLIFFKTGRKSLHVGISMGDGTFLHASVSSGVMISNIRERYWATRYLGARRVL